MLAEVEQLLGRRSSKPVRGHSTFDFGRQSRFDVLRIARSDAVNPGMGTEDVVTQRHWKPGFGNYGRCCSGGTDARSGNWVTCNEPHVDSSIAWLNTIDFQSGGWEFERRVADALSRAIS
jgi:hypothetical protein